MLFAISGSQGSGKSTVIKTLRRKGFPIIERKTSRSILDEWGVTLSEVNNDRELTVKFQDEILDRKIADDLTASTDTSRIYFTERTLADFFTYALIAIGKDNEYNEWVNEYFQRCCDSQEMYSHNFYLTMLPTDIEDDGVRGSNLHYARMVDVVMRDVTERMYEHSYDYETGKHSVPETTIINSRDNDARVNEILKTISRFI